MNNVFVFKRLLPAVLALTAAALSVACDEDSDSGKSDRKTIVGHWVYSAYQIFTFRADGTFESGCFNSDGRYYVVEAGTYSYKGSELTRNIFAGEEVGSFKTEAVVVRADSLAIKNPDSGRWYGVNGLPDAMYNQMLDLEEVPEPEKAIVGYWTDYAKPKPGNLPYGALAIFADGRFDHVSAGEHMPYELSGRWLTTYYEGRVYDEYKVAAASASTLVLLRLRSLDNDMYIWYLRRISEDEYNRICAQYE